MTASLVEDLKVLLPTVIKYNTVGSVGCAFSRVYLLVVGVLPSVNCEVFLTSVSANGDVSFVNNFLFSVRTLNWR